MAYIQAKKSLGQNFLKSKKALNDIANSADISDKDIVLEIGPGMGDLTELLIEKAKQVIAIEKDDRLIPILTEKFTKEIKSKKFKLIHGDILEILEDKEKNQKKSTEEYWPAKYKLVANIPYYITGAILRGFLSIKIQPSKIVLLVQKEVAERIIARDKKESLLSISVKVYGKPKIISRVPAGAFVPVPNVDSAVLSISDISKSYFTDFTEENFFKILKAGFAHKRKLLSANLRTDLKNKSSTDSEFSKEKIAEAMLKSNIKEKSRSEDLDLKNWSDLVKNLTN